MGAFLRYRAFWLSTLFSLSLCILPFLAHAQITFERTYGDAETNKAFSVEQTSDGGYIITGSTYCSASQSDVYLIKTDSVGDILWERTYGGDSLDEGNSVGQTLDLGYILTGYTRSLGVRWADVYLVKTDPTGDKLWEGTCGGIGEDFGYWVQQTSDRGYVIAGMTQSFGDDLFDAYLIKTDSLGVMTWQRTYGDVLFDQAGSVQQTQDGGYVISGTTGRIPDSLDIYVVKTDSLGNTDWAVTTGGPGSDGGPSVRQTYDGGYIVGGNTSSSGAGGQDVYLVRMNPLGDTTWTRAYGGPLNDIGCSVWETEDSGYIIAGYTASYGEGAEDVYLVKVDSLGDTLWTRTHGGAALDHGYSVQQTSDRGCVVAGYTESFGAGEGDVYLIKTDENGMVARDAAVLSIDAPLADTVLTDSTYPVMATVHNYRPSFVFCWVKATIGAYVDSAHTGRVDPDSSVQVTFSDWQVPSGDSATYTLTICAEQQDDVDTTNDCIQKTIFAYDPTGVQEGYDRPVVMDFRLQENKPNPFHRSTLISYSLPAPTEVTLSIYDLTGRLVETLVNETQQPGIHQIRWKREDNPSGVYFYRLDAGEFVETRKMVVIE